MILLCALIYFIAMQSPETDGFSQPPRSRKMLYGKSKVAFQPFVIKSDDLVSKSAGNRRQRSRNTAVPASPIQNDVARAAEDENTSTRVHESSGLNPIEALEALNRQREGNMVIETPTTSASKISSDMERIALADTPITSNSNPQPAQPQLQRTGSQNRDNRDNRSKKPSTGLANIYWRAVDVEDLRLHPYFKRFESEMFCLRTIVLLHALHTPSALMRRR
jgi:hypothetical protein